MIIIKCAECGSEDLQFDANAVWNVKLQEYQFELCSDAWCNSCDDLVNVIEKEIDNEDISI
jgi:hypothetical protein